MSAVGVILGSDSDLPKVRDCFEILDEFSVDYEVIVSSAHRSPEKTVEWVQSASKRGLKVIIAVAGGAAHLPGVVAAQTVLPVLGVPVETKIAGGLDSILSILQMPAGIPVATMPTGKSGGANAALFAISILAVSDSTLTEKLISYRKKMETKISEKNKSIKEMGLMNYIDKLEGKK
ncbi:MAG TPA: 5-(carboxyamino)imidazole ribonucleotide mutase [Spirochaetota bacterium]|nr:5-(carboxyamino)imidazole ribonucleotide mutase [Spirochaetota bacterium]HPS88256.1 5-(carboxyamino)imidazole ribonucleotide mutase [Spirochaetota bacterium]